MPQVRPYRGIDAAERLAQRRARLIDAGLEILGAAPPAPELTVRTICGGAGVAMRYFYESFSDKDVFVEAVFDHVVADLAATTQAAVAAAPPDEQSRAGMANIVHAIAGDPRVGRLLFSAQLSNEVVARKRNESTAFFAMLLGQHAGDALQLPAGDRRRAGTHFAVGGVAQTLSAWLSGEITFTPDELVDHLALLLNTLGKRAVRR
ncbi:MULTISPECIES: TetR/AcrR family transcriptional regulator [Mycobacteriaceae]|uniref:TetR/AcrR family transcriptional regulator n=1 Tax=Mycolicibacterium mucogenicum DSM 44124 TaxID=1226753 RepID=A0A8H2J8H1_MYCMU|nr:MULTISPECIES: TetR/AcrR family transcriptional regulator [Mycobacteriaceae]KAB7758920.1 TetR family transcriptional regulator [Mycolicibacterium mucogenicum DSM 44124]QPG69761.1 TetR/AcrR family transcriptional regulator [Mycolicibacterium mucogenicum DSM 44124]